MSATMDALVGLRRRVAAHEAANGQIPQPGAATSATVNGAAPPSGATASSIVQRVRRRNELLDEQIRRNSFGQTGVPPPAPTGVPVVAPPASGGDSSGRVMYMPRSQQQQGSPPPAIGEVANHSTTTSTSTTPASKEDAPTAGSTAPTSPASNGSVATAAAASAGGGHPQTRPSSMNIVAQVQPVPPSGAKPAGTSQHPSYAPRHVDERKLTEWRKRPINSSPYDPRASFPRPTLLPSPAEHVRGRKTLVLDIDETLVHASFTPSKPFNVRLLVEVEGERGFIYVAFRPHLHRFLSEVCQLFEVVVFTASQRCYADQLMDSIDPSSRLGRLRLFREHCTEIPNARVKDLSFLGRSLDQVAIVDNSPVAYLFQVRNAIPIESWFDDPHDAALLRLLPMLRELAKAETVYDVLDPFNCSLL